MSRLQRTLITALTVLAPGATGAFAGQQLMRLRVSLSVRCKCRSSDPALSKSSHLPRSLRGMACQLRRIRSPSFGTNSPINRKQKDLAIGNL
jgi:hypothetical protein